MNDELRVKNNELGGKMNYRYRNDEEMKDSGVEWIGNIPIHWKVKRVKHIFELKKEKSDIDNPVILSLTQKGIKVRDISNNEGQIAASYLGYTKIVKNDFVLNPMDLLSGYIDKAEFEGVISPAYTTFAKKRKVKINHDFYKQYFQMHYHHNFLFPWGEGVSFEHRWTLKNETFLNLPVIEPCILEQEKIANFLDEKTAQFDSIISKKEALIEKLEEAKKSLISEVVTGKVRVVKTDDGYELVEREKEEMKDSGVEWLGDIPIEWDISKLKYIGESITGLTYSPKDIVDENKGILVLRSSNVQNGKIVFEDNVYVDMNIPDKLITKIGDIIICSRNGSRALIGKNACIREEQQGMSFGAFMTIFRSRYFEYLNFVFNSEIFKAQSGSFLTSTINQLTISNLNSFIIPLPNFKEQNIVVMYLREKISEYDKILDNIKMQIEKLKEAKQSLISEAVTGKIEILN